MNNRISKNEAIMEIIKSSNIKVNKRMSPKRKAKLMDKTDIIGTMIQGDNVFINAKDFLVAIMAGLDQEGDKGVQAYRVRLAQTMAEIIKDPLGDIT